MRVLFNSTGLGIPDEYLIDMVIRGIGGENFVRAMIRSTHGSERAVRDYDIGRNTQKE